MFNKAVADMQSDNARRILEILADGGEGRFVGGCVRDHLLNKPYFDVDIATTHTPDQVMALMKAANVNVIPTGLKHGTVTAVLDEQPFEITTLRNDIACDGRHAEVEFTTDWEQDAARRDFTINAMYMDAGGEIYDYFSGKSDLDQLVLRFVGDANERIQEDYLRILRLFRFQAHYCDDFSLPMQIEACAANLDGLDGLSGERIQMEMLKILSAPKPLYVLMVMNKIGVFNHLVPGASEELNLNGLKELMRLEVRDEDVANVNPYIRLAAMLMLANPSPEVVVALAERWKLSSDDRNFLRVILDQEHHIRSDMNEAQAKKEIRQLTKEYFISTAIVRWTTECGFAPENKVMIDEAYKKLLAFVKEWKVPIMPIRGRDLLELGIDEGKEVGVLLKKAEELWEANDYKTTRDELFAFVNGQLQTL